MNMIWRYVIVFSVVLVLASAVIAADAPHTPSTHAPSTSAPAATETIDGRAPLTISKAAQAAVGLQTEKVTRQRLSDRIRTVGSIMTDQTLEASVNTRVSGWIEKIQVNYVGMSIKKGDPLYELYAPDLISTQEEYLTALTHGASGAEAAAAALMRLRLWGVSESELRRLRAAKSVLHAVTFYAPVDGVVIRKSAVQGAYVTPQAELYYLADLSTVWLLLTLYEADVSLIDVGDSVTVSLPYDPARRYVGEISYIYPEIDTQTRTAKARVEIVNSDGFLRPGMFANAEIAKELPDMLVISADAVLDTGQRKLVFIKDSESELIPQEVELGTRVGDKFTILSGLKEGDAVVVGATFLIDAESRLQAALRKGKAATPGHGEHGK
jgi:Cu(I)/Ag(I) efflux system membrane fusion protein